MRTTWRDGDVDKAVTAPLSLIVSAFAPVADARRALTPQLRTDGDTVLLLIDLGGGKNRLGGSALAQVYGQLGNDAPDVDDPRRSPHSSRRSRRCMRSTSCSPITTAPTAACSRRWARWRSPRAAVWRSCIDELPGSAVAALFNEELGAVLQVRAADRHDVVAAFEAAGLRCVCVGEPTSDGRIRIVGDSATLFDASRVDLHRAWSATTHALQRLRDNPACADQEYERILDAADPGLAPHAHLRSGRGHRRAVHRDRRAAARRDPARAGRQRPDRDGGGIRSRRASPPSTCT